MSAEPALSPGGELVALLRDFLFDAVLYTRGNRCQAALFGSGLVRTDRSTEKIGDRGSVDSAVSRAFVRAGSALERSLSNIVYVRHLEKSRS